MLEICEFVVGDGTGGTEKEIGSTSTEGECASLVLRKEPSANGATWEVATSGSCYAEFRATGNNGNSDWRTCLFKGQLR